MEPILEVDDLRVYYKSIWGDYKSVDGVSVKAYRNEVLSIAGESGCGKSTLVEGILRLVKPPGYIPTGKVIFEGIDILRVPEEELRRIRWSKLAYVPQGAMNSLNPVIKVEEQMVDAIIDHSGMDKEKAKEVALAMLKEVGLPVEVANMYPHQLSGGMKQRVIIATAIALKPNLVIADEPTTALDVVVQRGILQLLRMLKENYHMTVIMVSHDMAAHAQIADRIAIMYAGKIVEVGLINQVFKEPLHPYTKGLISAIPAIGKKYVKGIPGLAPSPLNWPSGCRFHPRCQHATELCVKVEPSIREVERERFVACHLYG
ncbi:ABC transporter ATP-binding protein [Candidatus Bathyarchaeota archaeon]|nr:ABC transporter ATP-binding protein [Candidatus Bathyarchaeota archaeon]